MRLCGGNSKLRLTTQSNMHVLRMMMMVMWASVVMVAAQPRCDPLTQYEDGGECCKMCGPGTSMSSLSTCLDPQCQDCGEKEYQDKYTKEHQCEKQPYCDPHRNFVVAVHHDTKKKSPCLCKEGFHCSSKECITCIPHQRCEPGYGVESKGNHLRDTVCQKCPEGTFSNESSWHGVCEPWTKCGVGQRILQGGTDTSDNTCEEISRSHVIVISVVCLLIVVGLIAGLIFWLCRGKQGNAKGTLKDCVESCLGEKKEPLKEATVLITTPTNLPDEESTLPEMQSSQEDSFLRTPVENEDEPSQEMSGDVLLTDKGNFVTQENGKTEILSRQESQTQTF